MASVLKIEKLLTPEKFFFLFFAPLTFSDLSWNSRTLRGQKLKWNKSLKSPDSSLLQEVLVSWIILSFL